MAYVKVQQRAIIGQLTCKSTKFDNLLPVKLCVIFANLE